MSSAILYLAIIAIWAGVLIPRWLRRDTSRTASAREAIAQELAITGDPASDSGTPDDAAEARDGDDDSRGRGSAYSVPAPAPRAEARRRVLAARRRLLWMLLGLEAAGAGLAVTGLAAWWVLAPPTVMLAGYLLLLREAAAADSERAAAEHEALQAREEARKRASERVAVQRTAPPAAAPATYAAAPVAADYEDLGRARDFTPGLRNAPSRDMAAGDATAAGDAYDQYTENRLRAVGD
jgi:hypothetical protein